MEFQGRFLRVPHDRRGSQHRKRIQCEPLFWVGTDATGIDSVYPQNFFTIVKALLNQAQADGYKSDGYHHYETAERELTTRYVQIRKRGAPVSFADPKILSASMNLEQRFAKPFAIRSTRLGLWISFGT